MKHAKAHSHIKVTESTSLSCVFVYVVIFLLLLPFVLFFFMPVDASKQTSSLAEFPEIRIEDGSFNTNYLSELGNYFEDRFAFRTNAISINSTIKAMIFRESGNNQVILGKDDYMFYSASAPDFIGKDLLSNSQLDSIAANLKVMQDNVEASGKQFLFTISPNKNTLYPDIMPYNYIKSSEKHNAERLEAYLSSYGVHYLNMFNVFTEDYNTFERVRYLKYDSHWDNRGALLASNAILTSLGIENIEVESWTKKESTEADLAKMNYPEGGYSEDEEFAIGYNDESSLTGDNWKFAYGNSVYDSSIVTNSNLKNCISKKLYMYRDSFGNSLIPYLSSTFKTAEYSKLVPYDIIAAINSKADFVVVERAERNLKYLVENTPVVLGVVEKQATSVTEDKFLEIQDLNVENSGNVVKISGKVDRYVSGQLLVTLASNNSEELTFETLKRVSKDGKLEFSLYLSDQTATKLGILFEDNNVKRDGIGISVMIKSTDKYKVIAKSSE